MILHAAAYKHVPMMEQHPADAVYTNIGGTLSALRAALAGGVERFVLVSTDKAVAPSSVMGAIEAPRRAGGVGDGRGIGPALRGRPVRQRAGQLRPVVPLFQRQLREGVPLTVTHPDMTRFFMTIPEASRLILQASLFGTAGRPVRAGHGQAGPHRGPGPGPGPPGRPGPGLRADPVRRPAPRREAPRVAVLRRRGGRDPPRIPRSSAHAGPRRRRRTCTGRWTSWWRSARRATTSGRGAACSRCSRVARGRTRGERGVTDGERIPFHRPGDRDRRARGRARGPRLRLADHRAPRRGVRGGDVRVHRGPPRGRGEQRDGGAPPGAGGRRRRAPTTRSSCPPTRSRRRPRWRSTCGPGPCSWTSTRRRRTSTRPPSAAAITAADRGRGGGPHRRPAGRDAGAAGGLRRPAADRGCRPRPPLADRRLRRTARRHGGPGRGVQLLRDQDDHHGRGRDAGHRRRGAGGPGALDAPPRHRARQLEALHARRAPGTTRSRPRASRTT